MDAERVNVEGRSEPAHLVREHCAYGLSTRAWGLWLLAALLILPHAITSGNWVFATLQSVNLVAILFITVFTHFHQGKTCPAHRIL